jgi:chemotaxis methyl-accepting protein methylase
MKNTNNLITELLIRTQGTDVSKYDTTFLNKSLQKRMAEAFCLSDDEYCKFLEENRKEGTRFVESLQISYSEFFRNPLTFAVLERIILPSLKLKKTSAKRKEIRIWSAACAAGQEAYSLAILLEEQKNYNSESFKFRIFATDQSEVLLSEARKGEFNAFALNNVNLKRIKECFDKNAKTFKIKPNLKENIDFSVFDLLNKDYICPPSSIFGDFDLVVCANLLFYYKPEYREIILEKVSNSMVNNGFLITGEAEREIFLNAGFREVYPYSAIFQKNK